MSEYIYATRGKPVRDEEGSISLPREEIVRCMSCRWLFLNKYSFHKCMKFDHNVYDLLGFCSWGERKGS